MLASLKPNLRRIAATALIILTTMIYGAINSALTKETSKHMNEAFLGEPMAEKIKQITTDFPCERDAKIAAISVEFLERDFEGMLSVRNKWMLTNFLVLFLCAYISSCIILPRRLAGNAT